MQSQSSLKQEIADLQYEVDVYHDLFNLIPIKVWFKDTANRILKVNQAAAEFEGKTVEELQGKSCYQLYPKDVAEAYYQDDLKVIQSGESFLNIIEPHVLPSTGEETWVETGKIPYYGKNTNVSGVIAFATDITEKQQIKQELQNTQQAFHETIDTLIMMVENDTNKSAILDYLQSLSSAENESNT